MLGETGIVDDVSEGGSSNSALPNTGMAIDARAKIGFGIVEMEGQDLVQPDESFDLLNGVIPTRGRTDVMAGSEEMSRVEANSKSMCGADGVVQGGEMFKGVAKARALSRCVFQRDANSGFAGGAKDLVQSSGGLAQALGIAGAEVGARMKNKKGELELVSELDFLDERLNGAIQIWRRRCGNINQIAGVAEQVGQVRIVPGMTVTFEFSRGIRASQPLHVVLDEHLDGFATTKKAAFDRLVRAAGS